MKSIPNLFEKIYRQREGRFTVLCANEERRETIQSSRLLGAIGGKRGRRIFYLHLPTFRAVAPFHSFLLPAATTRRAFTGIQTLSGRQHQPTLARSTPRPATATATATAPREGGDGGGDESLLPTFRSAGVRDRGTKPGRRKRSSPPTASRALSGVLATRTVLASRYPHSSPLHSPPHPTPPHRCHRRAAAYLHVCYTRTCVYSGRSPNG